MFYRSVIKVLTVSILGIFLGLSLAACDNESSSIEYMDLSDTIENADQSLIDAIAKAQMHQDMPYPYHTMSGDYLAGRLAANIGDMGEASEFLTRAMNKDKDNLLLLQVALPVSVAAGDFDKAYDFAKQVYDAKNLDSHLGMIVLIAKAVKDEDYVTAWKYADEMDESGLGMYLRPLLRAWLAAGDKSLVTAETILRQQIKKQPLLAALYFTHLGLLSEYRGDSKKAFDYYALAMERQMSVRMASLVGSFYEHNDHKGSAIDLYSKFAEDKDFHGKSYAQAVFKREKANILPPKNVTSIADGVSLALFDLASVLHQEKASRLAVLFASTANYLRENDSFNLILLGDINLAMENLPKSEYFYSKVDSSSDVYGLTQFRLADIYEQLGKWEKSISVLDRINPHKTLDAHIANKKADIYRRAEKYKEAIPLYDEVIASREFLDNPDWVVYYSRALCHEQNGNWDLAEKDLLKALDINADQPLLLNYLGYTWADKGVNIDKALAYIEKASNLAPNDAYIADSMGWVLFRLDRFEEAVKYMEKAVSIVPNDPVINDHVGDVYWNVGRRIEAKFQWIRALEDEEDEEDQIRIQNKIDNGYSENKDEKINLTIQ